MYLETIDELGTIELELFSFSAAIIHSFAINRPIDHFTDLENSTCMPKPCNVMKSMIDTLLLSSSVPITTLIAQRKGAVSEQPFTRAKT